MYNRCEIPIFTVIVYIDLSLPNSPNISQEYITQYNIELRKLDIVHTNSSQLYYLRQ